MMPVEREIRNLASNLQLVKDEQSYLVVRERVHRDTCESTVCGVHLLLLMTECACEVVGCAPNRTAARCVCLECALPQELVRGQACPLGCMHGCEWMTPVGYWYNITDCSHH